MSKFASEFQLGEDLNTRHHTIDRRSRSPPRPLPSAGALFDEMPRRSQGALRNGSCFRSYIHFYQVREEYAKLGSVFTVNLLNRRITFFVGPEVSVHFFKAPEADLSQQEVYQFNVPTFGPDVIFDVNYSMRQEQPRFFTEALRIAKLRSYVDRMVLEAQPSCFQRTTNQTDVVSARELRMLEVLLCGRADTWRVGGVLAAMSRAFGNRNLKQFCSGRPRDSGMARVGSSQIIGYA